MSNGLLESHIALIKRKKQGSDESDLSKRPRKEALGKVGECFEALLKDSDSLNIHLIFN